MGGGPTTQAPPPPPPPPSPNDPTVAATMQAAADSVSAQSKGKASTYLSNPSLLGGNVAKRTLLGQ